MSSRSCATGSVRSCGGSVRLGAALTSGGAHEVVLDALYERKNDKKTVRVLTVIVYVFCVSLAAIMLSLYYVFFWEPKDSQHAQRQVSHSVQRPPASPPPTCLTPHTGRGNSTVEISEPPDGVYSQSYENIGESSSPEIIEPTPAFEDQYNPLNVTASTNGTTEDSGYHDQNNTIT